MKLWKNKPKTNFKASVTDLPLGNPRNEGQIQKALSFYFQKRSGSRASYFLLQTAVNFCEASLKNFSCRNDVRVRSMTRRILKGNILSYILSWKMIDISLESWINVVFIYICYIPYILDFSLQPNMFFSQFSCSSISDVMASTTLVFPLFQWYEPSCRLQLVPIHRWFLLVLPT